MSVPLGLSDYEFDFDGLQFGANTNVDAISAVGLNDLSVAVTDRSFPRGDGDLLGVQYAMPRFIEFILWVRKGVLTDSAYRSLLTDVEGAFTVNRTNEQELHWKLPGENELFLRGRVARRRRILNAQSERGLTAIAIQIKATDPRVYEANDVVSNITTNTIVNNNGGFAAHPKIEITRTAQTRVRMINNTTGVTFDVNNITPGGTTVVGDMGLISRGDPGLVVYESSNNLYGKWVQPRTPLVLVKGNNDLSLLNGDTCQLTWYRTRL